MANEWDIPPDDPKTQPRRRRPRATTGSPRTPALRVAAPDEDWQVRLARTDKGLKRTLANAVTILVNDPKWLDVLAYDEFAQAIQKRKRPPWHDDDGKGEPGEFTDEDGARLQAWFSRSWSLDIGKETVADAATLAARKKTFHSVRDWLESIEWDGAPRLETWLTVFLGAAETRYSRAVGKAFLIGGVARAMSPGEKVDTMLILEGAQGLRKSTALRTLVGSDWFVELSGEIDPKETPILLRRKWLAEFAELASFRNTRIAESIKSFLSRVTDTYRAPYARGPRDYPRQAIFAGTINPEGSGGYLHDSTGARRFWPIRCGQINIRGLEIDRAQLWAEALVRYREHLEDRDKNRWWLTDDEEKDATGEQDERYAIDAWTDKIGDWLEGRRALGATTAETLTHLTIPEANWTGDAQKRVGAILRRLGWAPRRMRRSGERERRYFMAQPENEQLQIEAQDIAGPVDGRWPEKGE